MKYINRIMNMIDWHMPSETQLLGIKMASQCPNIKAFIQPVTENYNKNVWENCAIIISQKEDHELKDYLISLMEWLQDMNWPGAFCILHRLMQYSDLNSLELALEKCMQKARIIGDEIWISNLNMILNSDS